MGDNESNDRAGLPLFTFVDENIFKKETFLGQCSSFYCFKLSVIKTYGSSFTYAL